MAYVWDFLTPVGTIFFMIMVWVIVDRIKQDENQQGEPHGIGILSVLRGLLEVHKHFSVRKGVEAF